MDLNHVFFVLPYGFLPDLGHLLDEEGMGEGLCALRHSFSVHFRNHIEMEHGREGIRGLDVLLFQADSSGKYDKLAWRVCNQL